MRSLGYATIVAATYITSAATVAAQPQDVLVRINKTTVSIDVARDDGAYANEQIWHSTVTYVKPRTHRVGIEPKSGLAYKYGTDRSVIVDPEDAKNSVAITCRRDAMSDREACNMAVGFNAASVQITRKGQVRSICLPGHDFPGRAGQIRVDRHKAVRTDAKGCIYGATAKSVVGQMKRGSKLVVRKVEWPYDYGKDTSVPIANKAALALKLWSFTNSSKMRSALYQPRRDDAHKQKIVARYGR